jgi:hypothetical protein
LSEISQRVNQVIGLKWLTSFTKGRILGKPEFDSWVEQFLGQTLLILWPNSVVLELPSLRNQRVNKNKNKIPKSGFSQLGEKFEKIMCLNPVPLFHLIANQGSNIITHKTWVIFSSDFHFFYFPLLLPTFHLSFLQFFCIFSFLQLHAHWCCHHFYCEHFAFNHILLCGSMSYLLLWQWSSCSI